MTDIKGKKLALPTIADRQGMKSFKDFTDRRIKHSNPLRCGDNQWAFVYCSRDYDLTNEIIRTFREGSASLGMSF